LVGAVGVFMFEVEFHRMGKWFGLRVASSVDE